MRSRSIMLIMVSLGFGAIAAVGMLQVLSQRNKQNQAEETAPVLVALTDLDIKDELTPTNVEIQHYPISLVPDGVVTNWDDAQGKRIMARVHRGMPIMGAMLFDKHQLSDVVVPDGYKVIAISVNKQDSFHGLLKAGDRIDIIGVRRVNGDEVARTFLKNVQVYAVDNKTDRIPEADGSTRTISTVQLVVNQEQAERITLYERQGDIRLIMGSETAATEPILVDFDDERKDPPKSQSGPSQISQLAKSVGSVWEQWKKTRPQQVAPPKPKTEHVMTVMSTTGAVVNYEWADKSAPPTVARDNPTVPEQSVPGNTPVKYAPRGTESGKQSTSSGEFDTEDADY